MFAEILFLASLACAAGSMKKKKDAENKKADNEPEECETTPWQGGSLGLSIPSHIGEGNSLIGRITNPYLPTLCNYTPTQVTLPSDAVLERITKLHTGSDLARSDNEVLGTLALAHAQTGQRWHKLKIEHKEINAWGFTTKRSETTLTRE